MDEKIGIATVYRMINMLEEIGAISRRNMYKVECPGACPKEDACVVVLDDESVCRISPPEMESYRRRGGCRHADIFMTGKWYLFLLIRNSA